MTKIIEEPLLIYDQNTLETFLKELIGIHKENVKNLTGSV